MITLENRESFLLAMLPFLPKEIFGVEIGVLKGDFSKMILEIIKPKCLMLIDPFVIGDNLYPEWLNNLPTAYSTEDDYNYVVKRFEKEVEKNIVWIIKEYSYIVAPTVPDKSLDFVYLDGSHLYEDVKRDIVDWLPKLKQGGLMCGHDYIQIKGFGVIQAVDEFVKEHNLEINILNENGGDWAIKL